MLYNFGEVSTREVAARMTIKDTVRNKKCLILSLFQNICLEVLLTIF